MRMFKKDEGFTLVELMVVVLIIGILVAVAIPVFNAASASARRRACQANLRTLDGACEQYVASDPTKTYAQIVTAPGTALGPYVQDFAGSSQCPADNTAKYSFVGIGTTPFTGVTITCTNSAVTDHKYK